MPQRPPKRKIVALRESVTEALEQKFGEQVRTLGLNWIVSNLLASALGIPSPPTRQELHAECGRKGSKGKGVPRLSRRRT